MKIVSTKKMRTENMASAEGRRKKGSVMPTMALTREEKPAMSMRILDVDDDECMEKKKTTVEGRK